MATLHSLFHGELFLIERAERAIDASPVSPGFAEWDRYVLLFQQKEGGGYTGRMYVQPEDSNVPNGWDYVRLADLGDYNEH